MILLLFVIVNQIFAPKTALQFFAVLVD